MKNRMRGRTQKCLRERKQVRRPRAGRKYDCVSADSMSIFQDNAFNPSIAFIQGSELCLAPFNASRLRVFEEGRDNAAAFDVTGVGIEEAVLKSVRSKRRKTLVE